MARVREDLVYRPDLGARKAYAKVYELYREFTLSNGAVRDTMRALRNLG